MLWNIIRVLSLLSPTQGATYSISQAGDQLNVRASPSLEAEVVKKLHPGDRVEILGDMMQADGYYWWKINLDDQLEGWAVNIPEWYVPVTDQTAGTPVSSLP